MGPILLGMLFLMGIAPLLPWRRATQAHLLRHLMQPVAAGLGILPLLAFLGVREWPVFVALGLVVFVVVGHLQEFWRGIKIARAQKGIMRALFSLIEKNHRRYGGYIIHLGVIVMALGITISNFYRSEVVWPDPREARILERLRGREMVAA